MFACMLVRDIAVAVCSAVAVVCTDAGGRAELVLVHVLDHTIEYTNFDPGQFIALWAASLLHET